MEASEIRQDKISKQWVIYAPARGKRPKDMRRESRGRGAPAEHDPDCPFCPGNEDMLPQPVLEAPGEYGRDYKVKVIPNKFPAITEDGDGVRLEQGPYLYMSGKGRHEVIIETPKHNRTMSVMSPGEIQAALEVFQSRFITISESLPNSTVVIFRNHGPSAGTSLEHPHSQLIATSWIPRRQRIIETNMRDYFDSLGRCVICDILDYELNDRSRMILETDHFAAMVPYAAETPFHSWIVPKSHKSDFGSASDQEKAGLAEILKRVLSAMRHELNDPDYNFVINTAPRYQKGQPHVHWRLEIRPRLITRAGFELGSGIRINPSLPEQDAMFLRRGMEEQ